MTMRWIWPVPAWLPDIPAGRTQLTAADRADTTPDHDPAARGRQTGRPDGPETYDYQCSFCNLNDHL